MAFISKISKFALFALLVTGLISCSDDDEAGDVIVPSNTIADFVAANDNYSSLAAALEVAGLTSTLDGSANYTVFAPNNAAFNTFLSDNGFASLDEVPEDLLREVLLNHVQAGVIMSSNLATGYISSMATGMASEEPLSMYINTEDGVMINGMAEVTNADIDVDNGVIHAVDAVIGLPDVVDFATADPTFDILVQALTREDEFTFVETLQMTDSPAPFTVFAPTNDAFVALLDELEVAGLGDIQTETLSAVLTYHVVTEVNVRSADLSDDMMVETLNGDSFTVNLGDTVTITDANDRTATVVAADVQANNGVIHVLDTVILPGMEE
ncbi:MAG TPA: fasciclin domain-containing protein [Salegentibacter sp.]|uniref:fasciclin domain-containing protein n=1 Tax=Salegentibacter sp. TaxID=1903072 RepID=UPI002F93FD24